MPGTDRWKPVHQGDADDDTVLPDDEMIGQEEVPGVLIVRVRDDLDFGKSLFADFWMKEQGKLIREGILFCSEYRRFERASAPTRVVRTPANTPLESAKEKTIDEGCGLPYG